MTKTLNALRGTAAVLALIAAAPLALAQAWPSKTVTWIVPFSAGGPTDGMARDIAAHVSKELGQQIIIENAGGAGGTIGAAKAAKATPDGYTCLLYTSPSPRDLSTSRMPSSA